jgi:DNA-binding MarR family transcriptional regulator
MTTEPAATRFPSRQPTVLLREIIDATEEFSAHLGRELDVNRTDLEAMEHLIANGPLSPTELAHRLGISTAAVTAVVDRLVAVEHVHRENHPTDRRAVLVVPAQQSIERAMGTLMPMIMGIDSVLDGYTPEQQQIIASYLERVLETYRAQVPPA